MKIIHCCKKIGGNTNPNLTLLPSFDMDHKYTKQQLFSVFNDVLAKHFDADLQIAIHF
jgi:hypothetical protein